MEFQVISRNYWKCFNDTAAFAFFKITLAKLSAWGAVFTNNLGLYLKDLKPLLLAIIVSKLVASIFE